MLCWCLEEPVPEFKVPEDKALSLWFYYGQHSARQLRAGFRFSEFSGGGAWRGGGRAPLKGANA